MEETSITIQSGWPPSMFACCPCQPPSSSAQTRSVGSMAASTLTNHFDGICEVLWKEFFLMRSGLAIRINDLMTRGSLQKSRFLAGKQLHPAVFWASRFATSPSEVGFFYYRLAATSLVHYQMWKDGPSLDPRVVPVGVFDTFHNLGNLTQKGSE